jgi:hypothetical protein
MMRNAFLVLVLANLGFAAWHSWFSGDDGVVRTFERDANIRLVGEETRIAATAPSEPAASGGQGAEDGAGAVAVASVPLRCVSVGPMPNRLVVDEAASVLTRAGFLPTQRTAQGNVWLGHWVYIDAIETQAEANAIVDVLAENGIGEAYVIADGANGNIVSLGVFTVRQRAEQRLSDARALGYPAIVADRSQPGTVYWLDVRAAGDRGFRTDELPALAGGQSLQFAPCPGTESSP